LRMARLDSPQCHIWPHCMSVLVNDTEVAHIEPPKTGQKRRADAPIKISLDSLSSSHDWRLEVRAELAPTQRASEFVLCVVQLAPVCSLSSLLADCLSRPEMSPAESSVLWDRLHGRADSAVECATPLPQPLVCPLTRERMRVPARGGACRHLRCFDLEAYLETSARAVFHRRWRCPVCDLPLPPSQLVICSITKTLLKQTDSRIAAVPLEPVLLNHTRLARAWCQVDLPQSLQSSNATSKSAQAYCTDACRQQPDSCSEGSSSLAATKTTMIAREHTRLLEPQAVPRQIAAGVTGVKRRRRWKGETLTATMSSGEGAASWGQRLGLNAGPPVVFDL